MGSSQSGAEGAGEWTEDHPCECSVQNHRAFNARLKSVPLRGQSLAMAARVAALGLLELKYGWQQYSHDCVELWVKCKRCQRPYYLTLEYFSSGKSLRAGRYVKIKGQGPLKEKQLDMALSDALQVFERVAGSSKDYDAARFNCKHWAGQMFRGLCD